MKKLIFLALVAILAVSLVACKDKKGDNSSEPIPDSSQSTVIDSSEGNDDVIVNDGEETLEDSEIAPVIAEQDAEIKADEEFKAEQPVAVNDEIAVKD